MKTGVLQESVVGLMLLNAYRCATGETGCNISYCNGRRNTTEIQCISRRKKRLEQVEKQMETKADKVTVDELAVEAGSLEGKVTSLAMNISKINKTIDMVRDEFLEENKMAKI